MAVGTARGRTTILGRFVGRPAGRLFAHFLKESGTAAGIIVWIGIGIVLAIIVMAIFARGILNISVATAIVYIPTYFPIIRTPVAAVKQEPYVEAAIALGMPRRRIITRYVLPNVAQSIPVIFSVNAADSVLTEAGLTFLGLGLPPGIPDWGFDISLNWQRFEASWWATFYLGLFILIL